MDVVLISGIRQNSWKFSREIGGVVVDSAEEADAVIINTCTVVGPTERKMLRRLSLFRDRDLYVTGCMPAVQSDAIRAVCTPTIIPPAEIRDAYRSVGTVVGDGAGIVQIAQGCSGRCTYCITRAARGPLKSNKSSEILSQIDAFVRAGSPEIQTHRSGRDCLGKGNRKYFTRIVDVDWQSCG